MKRKKSDIPTRVWAFGGVRWIDSNGVKTRKRLPDSVYNIYRQGRDYYNQLVLLYNAKRTAYRQAREQICPGFSELETEVRSIEVEKEKVRGEVKDSRVRARKRVKLTPEQKEKMRLLSERGKPVYDRLKTLRKEAKTNPELKKIEKELNVKINTQAKSVYASSSLHWGVKNTIRESVQQANSKTSTDLAPRRELFSNIAVQFQRQNAKAKTENEAGRKERVYRVRDLFRRNGKLELERPRKKSKDRTHPVVGRIYVGKDAQKRAIWENFKVTLHRDMPDDGEVKWARIVSRQEGTEWVTELQIVVEAPLQKAPPPTAGGLCAIDIGWRKTDDGLRVATLFDGSEVRTLNLPVNRVEKGRLRPGVMEQLEHAEDIRSIRDRAFNETKDRLSQFLKAASSVAPVWLIDETKYMHNWKNPAKLARVVWKWKENRFDGDEIMFFAVETWRKQDKHLYEYETNDRRKARFRRREIYRKWGKELALKYDQIVLEHFNIADVAKLPSVEGEKGLAKSARANRQKAAISEFRNALEDSNKKYGRKDPIVVDAVNTSSLCPDCGQRIKAPGDASLRLVCTSPTCKGKQWDRDEVGARNIYRRGMLVLEQPVNDCERSGDAETTVGTRENDSEDLDKSLPKGEDDKKAA